MNKEGRRISLMRALYCVIGFLSLPSCVYLFLLLCRFEPAVPMLADGHDISQQVGAAATLSQLSGTLFTMDLSLIGVSAILLKVSAAESPDKFDISLGAAASIAAVFAMIAGYRFLMGLSEQLALDRLRLAVLSRRINIQATLTLLSASFLVSLLFDRFRLHRKST